MLGGTDARPPVARLSLVWRHSDDNDFAGSSEVDDGELELAREDPARSILVRRAHVREFRSKRLCLLNRPVKSLTETRADRCEVLNLVEKLFPGLLNVAYRPHRWNSLRAWAWTSAPETRRAVPDSTALTRRRIS